MAELAENVSKVCSRCKETKPLTSFVRCRWNYDGYNYYCKECRKLYQREYSLKKMYGITIEQYNEILDSQDNLCAICKSEETRTNNGIVNNLSVDHSHETGRVRGLLCTRCNSFIGMAMENKDILLNAIEYLDNSDSLK